jgi:gamma-glutamyl-gamma-aminobutyrate hydrolase PuuD
MPDGFCIGVQWHPETLTDAHPHMARLFDEFIARAGSAATHR